MSKQQTGKLPNSVGDNLIEALTHQEIAKLLDVLLTAVSPTTQNEALDQLPPNTKQTVQQILTPSQTPTKAVSSTAKLEQTWSDLWREWDAIVLEGSFEDGEYIAQEEHWEPPYFDQYAFINDLEKVAEKMRPLIPKAVEQFFSPSQGFAEAIEEAEDAVNGGLPEWMELHEGFYLEEHLTYCVLAWEWHIVQEDEKTSFDFAQKILDWEDILTQTVLDENTFLDFFDQLSKTDQEILYRGFTNHKDEPSWKKRLNNTHSYWHTLYMTCVEQQSPERYLDNLRTTIPQQWQNGLPIIEDFLTKKAYQESLQVVQETMTAMLKSSRNGEGWAPETSLLLPLVNVSYSDTSGLKNHKSLLRFYRKTAVKLNQTQLANTLAIQLTAFNHFFDWEKMLQAFADAAVSEQTRQALFESWRKYIIKTSKPHTWNSFSWNTQSHDEWWLHWLIESVVDGQKGADWFQQEIKQWLAHLPTNQLGDNFAFLRLLTADLAKINNQSKKQYPKFYQVVIRPSELTSPDQNSRRAYLKQVAADDLFEQVMAYWKKNLQNLVPKPELAQKSIYTQQANWMAALRELVPHEYALLLNKWRVDHQRRRNLWKAMAKMGLD